MEAEEMMLSKLKVECGHNTVNKMSSMFTDINLSKEMIAEFKNTPNFRSIAAAGVDYEAEVLTNGHWPEKVQGGCTLPPEMKDISLKFENFYKQKH
jgi:hypothetical protein